MCFSKKCTWSAVSPAAAIAGAGSAARAASARQHRQDEETLDEVASHRVAAEILTDGAERCYGKLSCYPYNNRPPRVVYAQAEDHRSRPPFPLVHTLLETGRVKVSFDPQVPRELDEAVTELDLAARPHLAFEPQVLSRPAASWALLVTYRACQEVLMFREIEGEVAGGAGGSVPGAAVAVGLLFRRPFAPLPPRPPVAGQGHCERRPARARAARDLQIVRSPPSASPTSAN